MPAAFFFTWSFELEPACVDSYTYTSQNNNLISQTVDYSGTEVQITYTIDDSPNDDFDLISQIQFRPVFIHKTASTNIQVQEERLINIELSLQEETVEEEAAEAVEEVVEDEQKV